MPVSPLFPDWAELSLGNHEMVHQAAGMIWNQLDITFTEALARLRAHTYSTACCWSRSPGTW